MIAYVERKPLAFPSHHYERKVEGVPYSEFVHNVRVWGIVRSGSTEVYDDHGIERQMRPDLVVDRVGCSLVGSENWLEPQIHDRRLYDSLIPAPKPPSLPSVMTVWHDNKAVCRMLWIQRERCRG